ncbi:MAG TPA: ComEC/Rec2 family competence protein, partial [Nitrospiria bacterium]
VHVPAPPMMVVLALYGLAALLVPIRGWGSWKCFLAAGLSGLVLVWAYRIASEPASGNLQVVFFDVGQGDGAWLRFPDGRTMIIDGGRSFKNFDIGRMVIAPFLWNQGQYHVDTVVATHPQLDHVGGLEYLLKKFRVGEVWTNGRDKEAVFYRRFLSVIEEKEIPRLSVGAANFAGFSGTDYEVRVLNPVHSGAGGEVKKKGENDQSIVLRIQYGDEAILFTGDIEGSAERDLLEREVGLKSTVLKVPHHGSRSSIEPEFIKAVRPEVAVISAGRNNPYRHPSSDTLEAYRKVRSDILRTDRQGAVVYVSDGEKRSIRTSADFKVVRVGWDGGIFKTEWKNIRKVLSGYWYGPLGKPMAGKSG